MDWIFDNIQVIIVIAGVIAFWVQKRREAAAEKRAAAEAMEQRRQRQAQRETQPQPAGPMARHGQDAGEAERTRRIQEEIRRKIAERRAAETGGRAPVPAESRRPAAAPPPLPRAPVPTPAPAQYENAYATAEEERQRKLAEQLAALERQRAEALRQAREVTAARAATAAPAIPAASAFAPIPVSLSASLHDRQAIRQAILLKEILDTPKSIRV